MSSNGNVCSKQVGSGSDPEKAPQLVAPEAVDERAEGGKAGAADADGLGTARVRQDGASGAARVDRVARVVLRAV